MNCNDEAHGLIHKYLDGDLTKAEEKELGSHLEECEACQKHLYELKRTITLLQSTEHIAAPANFSNNVMQKLPAEKKRVTYLRMIKAHPLVISAALIFIFMISGVFSSWNQDNELVVSKQEDLIIEGDTVIVPADVTVSGDLYVENGDLIIDGTVDGNVTLINGQLIENEAMDEEPLMAGSVGEVSGELNQVDQIFDWIWYQVKNVFQGVFDF
ncbi:anti-sigma factor [Virgibacillus sp. NKC19-16]|uniref:zf-HC2 domain-containing protein n=1 Tax=Virgibacillus salidurans TaxID=2831673 RepID=UPI001F41A6BA|nr:zf-HC2 domain-containing protein [Virgibacillus sp. NKC19-16]UJL46613.1 anti-sigma factor [Virgibacillus sp. NKC19-16]